MKVLTTNNKASLPIEELRSFDVFEDEVTQRIYIAGYKAGLKHAFEVFEKNPGPDAFKDLHDAMHCYQKVIKGMRNQLWQIQQLEN